MLFLLLLMRFAGISISDPLTIRVLQVNIIIIIQKISRIIIYEIYS